MSEVDLDFIGRLFALALLALVAQFVTTAVIGQIPNIPFLMLGVAAFYILGVIMLRPMVDIDNLMEGGKGLIVFALVGLFQLALVTFGFIPANSPLLLGESMASGFFGIVFAAVQVVFYMMVGEAAYEKLLKADLISG